MSASDKARDFWDRISPRERKLVILLGVAVPIVVAIWLGLQIRDGLLDIEARNAANKAGFPIKGTITPRNPVTRNGFVTNSVQISLDDLELEKLKAFLQEVETATKVVVVTNLDIKRDFKDKKLVDAKLEVSTYSKEKPAQTDEKGEGSAEKKGG